ncbi:MAG: thiosulfate oxidation carrier protein SoxY [Rhodospirillales bacterium]
MTPTSVSLSRRQALKGASAFALTLVAAGLLAPQAHADAKMVEEAIKKLVKGTPEEGKIKLDLPQIAENGNTVPVGFEVDSPMSKDDYVKSVHVFAEGNPSPDVASFQFTPACGKAACSTRMRMRGTQNVVVVAEMSTGKVYMAKQQVKVTIGGCGG